MLQADEASEEGTAAKRCVAERWCTFIRFASWSATWRLKGKRTIIPHCIVCQLQRALTSQRSRSLFTTSSG